MREIYYDLSRREPVEATLRLPASNIIDVVSGTRQLERKQLNLIGVLLEPMQTFNLLRNTKTVFSTDFTTKVAVLLLDYSRITPYTITKNCDIIINNRRYEIVSWSIEDNILSLEIHNVLESKPLQKFNKTVEEQLDLRAVLREV